MFDLILNGVTTGLSLHDVAVTLVRVSVGVFFAISGYHKLFNKERHATLVKTFIEDRIPFIKFNEWFVPIVELVAGFTLTIGVGSVFSALLLGGICLVATCFDGLRRVREWKPLNVADYVDSVLYLPEVLLGLHLLIVVLVGPGAYSLDYILFF